MRGLTRPRRRRGSARVSTMQASAKVGSSDPAIEAVGVAKRFGKIEALSGLDLVAYRGHVTAVLGPNGAGKTTFVRAVATLIRPQAGTLRVYGIDVARQPAADWPRERPHGGAPVRPDATTGGGRDRSRSRPARTRRGRRSGDEDLLRWASSPPGPGCQPCWSASSAAARRAHLRPRSTQSQSAVGGDPELGERRRTNSRIGS